MKQFHYGEKGFALIELLVVVAILGFLSAVLVPNIIELMDRGKTEAYEAELHNIRTAVGVMLTDSTTGALTPVTTDDMDTVQTTDTTPLVLSAYLTGLDADGKVTTGCTYTFTADGTVTQTTP